MGVLLALSQLLWACSPSAPRGYECIAPAAAGGGWDLTCRLVARTLESEGLLDGPMRTVNMAGAGGGIAFAHSVGRRQADSTVIVAASPATLLRLAQGQYGDLRPDQVRWLGAVGVEYGVVAVARDSPWDSLGDLVGEWRRDPSGVVVSGGSAMAGQDHVKMMLLARSAGMDPLAVRYVAFDGGGEAITALLGGFVQVFSGELSEVEGHVEAGTVRILAVLSDRRLGGMLADVPTAGESGFPVTWPTWRGFYVPDGLSEEAYARWVDRLGTMAMSPAWDEARTRARVRPFNMSGTEFEEFVARQLLELETLSREIGLLE
jgi:putative tricarboxylic transport membrane protein